MKILMEKPETLALLFVVALSNLAGPYAKGQLTENEKKAIVGDAPAEPGRLASDLSPALKRSEIQKTMKKVADWQNARIADSPSQDWTFATLYVGMLAASKTLHEPRYENTVLKVAEHYQWTLGPRQTHADDQAIAQAYLQLYRERPDRARIAPLRTQFDRIMQIPDDPAKPVWWWCDALFMAPPVWANLSAITHDSKYVEYMDREWHITADLLWDPHKKLFSRDAGYLAKREANGRKVFWSRGNGWVMGGLVEVLQALPEGDSRRAFYIQKLKDMSEAVAAIQGDDGLWRAGLLDAGAYPRPEISGSAFFVYAMTWGVRNGILDRQRYEPVITRAWAGILKHIYADGRLGDIQPIGEAPGAYGPGASYVFGVGAFLLAGTELDHWIADRASVSKTAGPR